MLFADRLVVVRGGGDLATGVVYRLRRCGFPAAVLELERPLTVRRTVAVSTAVTEGWTTVDGLRAVRVEGAEEATAMARTEVVPVLVSPTLPDLEAEVVVDARMAKRALDTTIDDAPLVVALGPGFTAAVDCHAVVETQRGHRLGRVLWVGSAAPDTGTPGPVAGRAAERVLRAPVGGGVRWSVAIGDLVTEGQELGRVEAHVLRAPFEGLVRGLIAEDVPVREGMKIGDIDPRPDPAACHQISDKALAVGGGVVEAVMTWLDRSS